MSNKILDHDPDVVGLREHSVTLLGHEGKKVSFACQSGTTIHEAAQRAGYRLRVVCARGGCGACRATVISGRIAHCGAVSASKTQPEMIGAQPYGLLCRAAPLEDVVLWPEHGWWDKPLHPWSAMIRQNDVEGQKTWE